MKSKVLLRLALKQFYREAFSESDREKCTFEEYYNYFTHSLAELRVAEKHIAGRQTSEDNSQQKIEDDTQRLEFDVVDTGYWLFTFQKTTFDFDILNFSDALVIIKLIEEFKNDKNVTAFLVWG